MQRIVSFFISLRNSLRNFVVEMPSLCDFSISQEDSV